MKISNLIKKLNKLDPSGNSHVCVNNSDIIHIDKVRSGVDGPLEIIEYEDKRSDNISKVKLTQKGYKIRLIVGDVEDVIGIYPEMEIDVSGIADESYRSMLEESFGKWKKKVTEIQDQTLENYQE